MRQIWITKAGPPEVLQVRDAPDPEPKSGEVRIRVEASGVNFADVLGRLGLYPDLPRIPVVPGVRGCRTGRRSRHRSRTQLGRSRRIRANPLRRLGGFSLRTPGPGLYAASRHVR